MVSQPETRLYTGGAVQSCSPGSASPAPRPVPWVLLPGLANETEPSQVYWDKGPNCSPGWSCSTGCGMPAVAAGGGTRYPGCHPRLQSGGQGSGGTMICGVLLRVTEGPRWQPGFPPSYFCRGHAWGPWGSCTSPLLLHGVVLGEAPGRWCKVLLNQLLINRGALVLLAGCLFLSSLAGSSPSPGASHLPPGTLGPIFCGDSGRTGVHMGAALHARGGSSRLVLDPAALHSCPRPPVPGMGPAASRDSIQH